MSKRTDPTHDPQVLAVLHRTSAAWRLLVVRLGSEAPAILEATSFPTQDGSARPNDDELRRVRKRLDDHSAAEILDVLPAAEVICRCCSLPDAEPEHLEQALQLQAEAHMLAEQPEHRRGLAVLDSAPGETSRIGMMLAWPANHSAELPDLGRPIRHTSEAACVAALIDGHRPAQPLLSVDRRSGSVAIAISHGGGVLLRATLGAAQSDDWITQLRRLTIESALSVGHTIQFAESLLNPYEAALNRLGPDEAGTFIPVEVADDALGHFEGAPRDDGWLTTFGIAIGAVLASTGPLEPLTAMRDRISDSAPNVFDRIATRLADPQTALAVVVVCVLILGLIPVAGAGLRLGVLNVRHSDITERKAAIDQARAKLAMYAQLSDDTWSMTKLLSDVVSVAPLGIQVESIRISTAEQLVMLDGVATERDGMSAKDIINVLQDNVASTGIFRVESLDVPEKGNLGGQTFSLTAKVDRPHYRPDYPVEQDYARWSHSDRIYRPNDGPPSDDEPPTVVTARNGDEDEPRGENPPATARADDGDEQRPERRPESVYDTPPSRTAAKPTNPRPSPDENADGESARPRGSHAREFDSGVEAGSSPERVREETGVIVSSEPLSEEQINVMSAAEIRAKLPEIRTARKDAERRGDEETAERLRKEWDLLFARLREIGR